jgi:hypothetical protein
MSLEQEQVTTKVLLSQDELAHAALFDWHLSHRLQSKLVKVSRSPQKL